MPFDIYKSKCLLSMKERNDFTMLTFLIVCPAVFLAGLIDAIGGGGGLISLPIYLLAGLPPHRAIATNKLSSSMGTSAATLRFAKMGHINYKIALSCSVTAILGSFLGASLSVYTNEKLIQLFILILLPFLFVYLKKKKKDFDSFAREISKTTYIASILSAFVIGIYDGFYGPGTGTFFLCLTRFAGLDVLTASGVTKFINLVTNLTALVTFLYYGKVYLLLGFVAGICSILGNLIGSGMLTKNADKVLRPAILGVIGIFFIRTIVTF